MELKNNLYTITSHQEHEGTHEFLLTLLPDSIIYKAHFPGQAITPGVCITQMAVEMAAEVMQQPLTLVKVKNVKFLSVISPNETATVTCVISNLRTTDSGTAFQATVCSKETVFAKMSLTCTTVG